MTVNSILLVMTMLTIAFALFTIGHFFESHYIRILSLMTIILLLLCSLYSINKELKIREYYKFHIGYISCAEYYRRHLYHTGWHIYGQPGMTEEELMKFREENKDNMIIDGIILKEKAPE